MVKKKMKETEENNSQHDTEISDNKDNNLTDKEDQNSGPDSPSSGEEQISASTSEDPQSAVSAKKVDQEKQLLEKLAEMQDKYLRISAEFDNYRRRTLKEKMEITKYAGEDLLLQFLPFMDDFERALKHMEGSDNCQGIKEGLNLIYTKLSDFLKQQGIKEIEAINTDFDVDLHDAVTKIKVDEDNRKGKVVDVLLKGYFLKDKILRHSKVVIGE